MEVVKIRDFPAGALERRRVRGQVYPSPFYVSLPNPAKRSEETKRHMSVPVTSSTAEMLRQSVKTSTCCTNVETHKFELPKLQELSFGKQTQRARIFGFVVVL